MMIATLTLRRGLLSFWDTGIPVPSYRMIECPTPTYFKSVEKMKEAEILSSIASMKAALQIQDLPENEREMLTISLKNAELELEKVRQLQVNELLAHTTVPGFDIEEAEIDDLEEDFTPYLSIDDLMSISESTDYTQPSIELNTIYQLPANFVFSHLWVDVITSATSSKTYQISLLRNKSRNGWWVLPFHIDEDGKLRREAKTVKELNNILSELVDESMSELKQISQPSVPMKQWLDINLLAGQKVNHEYDFDLVNLDDDEEPNKAALARISTLPEIPRVCLKSPIALNRFLLSDDFILGKLYRFPPQFYYRIFKINFQPEGWEYVLEVNPYADRHYDMDLQIPVNQNIRLFQSLELLIHGLTLEVFKYTESYFEIDDTE